MLGRRRSSSLLPLALSRRAWVLAALGFAMAGAAGSWATGRSSPALSQDVGALARLDAPSGEEPITPLPDALPLDASKVALGGRLFHEPRLSRDGSVACATCHSLGKGGVDGLQRSVGVTGKPGSLNAPTVFNSGFNFRQFWDGRAESLEAQIDGPVLSPLELGSSWERVVEILSRDRGYAKEFADIYRDGVQVKNIKDAIATFERSLITPNSRFDRYLRGERAALTEDEIRGYRLFKGYGCVSCHQGINVGGNLYQKLGVMEDYFKARGGESREDLGRFNITGREEDRHVFKVPGLRNVALTGPYFHDGSTATLELAVAIMGRYQLGVTIPPRDIALIVKFLGALTGEYRGARP